MTAAPYRPFISARHKAKICNTLLREVSMVATCYSWQLAERHGQEAFSAIIRTP
ncbi:MAG: hypothetical protein KGJ57_13550 [Sphingomonadales bacterium]|nr:hypothetical protein [Sphingomonadales bacterium]MDE2170438.1 hypothetical protein [Sphingomonadales bacterium]